MGEVSLPFLPSHLNHYLIECMYTIHILTKLYDLRQIRPTPLMTGCNRFVYRKGCSKNRRRNMEKDLRAINKVYRKITDDDVKKKLEALIEDLETDDEGTEEPAEKVEEKKAEAEAETPQETEQPQEEVAPEEKQTFDVDEIKNQLGLEKVEALVVSYDEKIRKLEEEVKKSRNSGYSPGQAQQEPDTTVDDIFARLKTNHLKK